MELQRAVLDVVVEQIHMDEAQIDNTWTLLDLGATSFASVQLFMLLEERFGIEFSSDQVADLAVLPILRFHEVVSRARAAS